MTSFGFRDVLLCERWNDTTGLRVVVRMIRRGKEEVELIDCNYTEE